MYPAKYSLPYRSISISTFVLKQTVNLSSYTFICLMYFLTMLSQYYVNFALRLEGNQPTLQFTFLHPLSLPFVAKVSVFCFSKHLLHRQIPYNLSLRGQALPIHFDFILECHSAFPFPQNYHLQVLYFYIIPSNLYLKSFLRD